MSDLSKVNLFVSYNDVEIVEAPPFQIGIWRFSDTQDLDDLGELVEYGITKPILQRFGHTILGIDLPDNTPELRERLKQVHADMPANDTTIARFYTDSDETGTSSVNIYGDDILDAINKLVTMGIIGPADAEKLSSVYRDSMGADGFKVLDADAARAGAAARVAGTAPEENLDQA